LEGSRVKFIATATIGYDHIDTAYCREAGIFWTNCPGCNAGSVEQYVRSVLKLLEDKEGLDLEKAILGIVGVGHVGRRVKRMAESLGMKVLLNDPPRADQGEAGFVDLKTIMQECDIITFHTPLNRKGKYATYHLVNEEFLFSLERTPYIINASRGEVVDTASLLAALAVGKVRNAIIDTWEYEPRISRELLEVSFLATPHIAGYSADGKANATRMSLEALCKFFGIDAEIDIMPPEGPHDYNPTRDSEWLKAAPEKFEWFRGNYPIRRE
jgi:erythronate-4-phosphate dehydrogenase